MPEITSSVEGVELISSLIIFTTLIITYKKMNVSEEMFITMCLCSLPLTTFFYWLLFKSISDNYYGLSYAIIGTFLNFFPNIIAIGLLVISSNTCNTLLINNKEFVEKSRILRTSLACLRKDIEDAESRIQKWPEEVAVYKSKNRKILECRLPLFFDFHDERELNKLRSHREAIDFLENTEPALKKRVRELNENKEALLLSFYLHLVNPF